MEKSMVAAIRPQGNRRQRPILLPVDAQCLAQAGFAPLACKGLAAAARQHGFQRGQAQILCGHLEQACGRKQVGDEQQHGPSVAKRIR
jgi:hypothetical protein